MSITTSIEENLTIDSTGSTTYLYVPPAPPLTEEACQAAGGHCYEEANLVTGSIPPIHVRTCKHCGKRQVGTVQQEIRWEDA